MAEERDEIGPATAAEDATEPEAQASEPSPTQEESEPQVDPIIALEAEIERGDWIVARVLSMGDTRRYFLSTATPSPHDRSAFTGY